MRQVLFVLIAFVALTAIVGGLMMMAGPKGSSLLLGVDLLQGTPFRDFFYPGLILAFLIGGVNLAAVVMSMLQHRQRYNWSLAGGLLLCGWIIVQMLMLNTVHWLQLSYLFIGILIVLLSYQLKGKWAV